MFASKIFIQGDQSPAYNVSQANNCTHSFRNRIARQWPVGASNCKVKLEALLQRPNHRGHPKMQFYNPTKMPETFGHSGFRNYIVICPSTTVRFLQICHWPFTWYCLVSSVSSPLDTNETPLDGVWRSYVFSVKSMLPFRGEQMQFVRRPVQSFVLRTCKEVMIYLS